MSFLPRLLEMKRAPQCSAARNSTMSQKTLCGGTREREREKGYRFDNNEAQAAMCKHAEQLISRIIGFPFLELHLSGL